MTVAGFTGYFLLGMSPGLIIFGAVALRKSFLTILTFTSAFGWLISLIFTATLLRAFTPLPDRSIWYIFPVILGVGTQEALRPYVYKLWKMSSRQLDDIALGMGAARLNVNDEFGVALACGLGHGLAHSTMFFLGILPITLGPATYYADSCSSMPLFGYAAMSSTAFTLLHTFSMIIAFDGYASKDKMRQYLPGALHLALSLLTLINFVDGACVAIGPVLIATSLGTMGYAGKIAYERCIDALPDRPTG